MTELELQGYEREIQAWRRCASVDVAPAMHAELDDIAADVLRLRAADSALPHAQHDVERRLVRLLARYDRVRLYGRNGRA